MFEKKELNSEELEKVAGGAHYRRPGDIKWVYSKNESLEVRLKDNTLVAGKVTKRGYFGTFGGASTSCFVDCYYIESPFNVSVNGWYLPSNLVASGKVNAEITIVAW